MRSSLVILPIFGFCLRAQAQNPSDLIDSLRGAGLTSLASALQLANGTQEGQNLISQLMHGNHTLFAPDNQACEFFPLPVASRKFVRFMLPLRPWFFLYAASLKFTN